MNPIKRALFQVVSLTSLGCFAAGCQSASAPSSMAVEQPARVMAAPAPKPVELSFCAPVASYQPAVAVKAKAAKKQAASPRVIYTRRTVSLAEFIAILDAPREVESRRYVTLAEFVEILDAKKKAAAQAPTASAPTELALSGNL